jgi:small ligand-binding sensory domain FIST
MARFLHGLSTGGDWQRLCRDALAALGPVPASAGLGFVYLTADLASQAQDILAWLRAHTPIPHWVGSLGAGVIGAGRECYDAPAISLLTTHLDERDFRVIPTLERDPSAFLAATREWRHGCLASVALVHGDPRNGRLPQLILQLAQGLEGGFLIGGLSSATDQEPLQIADQVTSGGLSGVLLAGGVPLVTGLTQGCSLLGRRHLISEAQGNVLARLDGRQALEVLKEDVGPELAGRLERLGGYLFAALPIPGSDTGDYLVRNLIGIDPDGGMLAIGDRLQQGATLQFARRDLDSARQDLLRMLRDVKSRITGRPLGALYFSCLGRGRSLFGEDSAELRLVQQEFGDLPLAGFYANGEISHNRLYGYTGVLAVFTAPP